MKNNFCLSLIGKNSEDIEFISSLFQDAIIYNADIEFGQQSGRVSVARDYDDGNWHCYVGVKRNGKILLYFDGLL